MQTKGTNLHPDDQKIALSAFVHRFTKDHKPQWAYGTRNNGRGKQVPYMPQFASDQEWLENTLFTVKKDGRLDKRAKYCHSKPTWPDGIEPQEDR